MKKILFIIAVFLGIADVGAAAELPTRIVSLSPATTEILFALGLGDRVAGVTSFCDHPAEAKNRAKVGGMSNPSLEAIMELKPDLVVMTTDGNPREAEQRLRTMHIRTYIWTERTLADLPSGIRRMAAALGAVEAGEQLANSLERRLRSFGNRVAGDGVRRKALYIVWPEPLLVAGRGTAIHDALTLLGFENIAASASGAYPRYSVEEVLRAAPGVLFIGTGAGMDMPAVAEGVLKKLASVPAVRNGRVCFVGDGLYRLAPRVIEGIEELATCVR